MKNIVIFILLIAGVSGKFCRQFIGNVKHEFHLLKRYQRSNKTFVAFENFPSVDECAAFTRANLGLAFNFSPQGRYSENRNFTSIYETFHNCEVLDCPEYFNFSSMVNDSRFNYYSMYAKTLRKLFQPSQNQLW